MKIKMVQKLTTADFNSELEEILEKKDFDVTVKNLLLSMLYKIENSYKDYSKVKVNIKSKEDQISEILYIIREYCDKIDVVTPQTEESRELEKENKKCIVDIKKGYIKTYANELNLLYSLYIMKNKLYEYKEKIEKEEKFLLKFYETARANDVCEIIRDFDGWSWNINFDNNLEIVCNFIYQVIILIFGRKNIKKVITKDKKFIEKLSKTDKECLDYIYILIETYMALNNIDIYTEISNRVKDKKEYLDLVNDKNKFLSFITENKKKLSKEIGAIDEITNDEKRLREEYFERNSKLKNEEKIFSISYLEDMLINEREEKINCIKEQNKLLNPTEYIKLKEKLEDEYVFYDLLIQNIEHTEIRNKTIESLSEILLEKYIERVNKASEKEEIKNIIYEMRYFLLLPINKHEKVLTIQNLQYSIKNTINAIIDIAIDKEVIVNVSDSTSIGYDILKFIFESRNIDLEDLSLKLVLEKEEGKILINILDEQEIEYTAKLDLEKAKMINVKLNKKVKIFC